MVPINRLTTIYRALYYMPVSRFEIRVAWSTPSLSQVPVQITRSPSFTSLH
jgi:hypothetical protein